MSEEEIKLLVEGYRCGETTYQLARQFGCHRLTVSNVLKRRGVNVTKCTAQRQLDAEDVIAMYGDMCTSAEIAEKYGVGPNVILRCLRKRGVRIRGRWEY
jgi:DNA-binding CsgD family transcriptional regulator